ncbi:DUF4129 domain-containing protein [Nocardia stercoris]|uniref:DUF4129 domain-containing protein n=1 Tax=Nocardia stercoris TaxID=2483361 RepID=A0A3M2KUA4_9NOCA|nr:DUF4129 domain-containing protein [Nocardia stercoris]
MIALLALAVLTVRGYIPGTGGLHATANPTILTVALMPVLCLVSIVILLAGIVTSQHRLPLALPVGQERTARPVGSSRGALFAVIAVAAVAVLTAIGWAVYGISGSNTTPPARVPAPTSTPTPTGEAPVPTQNPLAGAPPLAGQALLIAGVSAAALILVAIAGLVVVAVSTRKAPVPEVESELVHPEAPTTLAEVAEMGLAAMIASGDDPRTAIIACYVAVERGLSQIRATAPLVSDTPAEVLARAFDLGALRDGSARELVTLFEEARFSPHSILEWQRMRAEQLLRIVLADLQQREALRV